MRKQLTIRARQKRIRRRVRRDEWHRLTRRPRRIDVSEAWNLEVYAARYIVPRLKVLKKLLATDGCAPAILEADGAPVGLPSLATGTDAAERWQAMLSDMLFAFEFYADHDARRLTATAADKARVRQGLRLFAEYYEYLWY